MRVASGPLHLDQLDELILWDLVRDGRASNAALADKFHVAPSTVSKRLQALRENGYIQSFHAQLDWRALGLPLQAVVAVRIRPEARASIDHLARKFVRMPWVVSVTFLGGADDFHIHLICASTDQLRSIVAKTLSADPAVAHTQTHVVFEHLLGAQNMELEAGWDAMRAVPSRDS